MGGGAGGGYSSKLAGVHDNAAALNAEYPISKSGYFGVPGTGKARLIYSADPAADGKKFFAIAGKGGTVTPIFFETGDRAGQIKGFKSTFPNGDTVTFRPETASTKTPGVLITVNSGLFKGQKIHFEKGN